MHQQELVPWVDQTEFPGRAHAFWQRPRKDSVGWIAFTLNAPCTITPAVFGKEIAKIFPTSRKAL